MAESIEEFYSRVDYVSLDMLRRYSRSQVALDMAWDHACDNPEGSIRKAFWIEVSNRIRFIARVRSDR